MQVTVHIKEPQQVKSVRCFRVEVLKTKDGQQSGAKDSRGTQWHCTGQTGSNGISAGRHEVRKEKFTHMDIGHPRRKYVETCARACMCVSLCKKRGSF